MLQYSVFLILAPFAAAIILIIAAYAWLRPGSVLARALAWYLFAVAGFLIANFLEVISGSPAGTEWFARVQYLFMPFIPVLWLRFTLLYVGHAEWAAPRRVWIFAVLPIITTLLAWSNDLHGLLWARYTFQALGNSWGMFNVLEYGPWFWANGIYFYVLLLTGTLLIILESLHAPRLFRMQSIAMIVGALLPLIFNLIYVFDLLPFFRQDYTPLAFALAGVGFAFSIFRHRLLMLSPVARAALIETMEDPMLVLDEQQRLIDMNPAAQRFLGVNPETSLGQPFQQVWPEGADISPVSPEATRPLGWAGAQYLARRVPPVITMYTENNPGEFVRRSYELHVSPLHERANTEPDDETGWLVVMHDFTLRRQAEDAQERANRALAQANTALLQLNEELEARVSARTESLRRRAAELEALTRVSDQLRQAASFDDLLTTLLTETARVLEFGSGVILLHEDEHLRLAALHNQPAELLNTLYPSGSGPLWQAMQTERLARFTLSSPRNTGNLPLNKLAGGYPNGIVAPMQTAGQSLGLLVFFYDSSSEPSHDLPLSSIAEMGANAIQRYRLVETLEKAVKDRTRALTILYEVTSATNAIQNVPQMLAHILEKALDVLHGRVGLVHLVIEDSEARPSPIEQPASSEKKLRLETALGLEALLPSAESTTSSEVLLVGSQHPGPWYDVFKRKDIMVEPDILNPQSGPPDWDLPADLLTLVQQRGAAAYVGVPIQVKNEILGVLSIFGESLASFSAEEIALLAVIADHLGSAVETAQLRQQAERTAVMEERQRMARDLHDSVTQSLFSMGLFATAGREALDPELLAEDGETETVGASSNVIRARQNLDRLTNLSGQVMKELRLLIYEMRPLAVQSEGLVGALRNRLENVEQHANMKTNLQVERAESLPSAIQTGLYGIAQEALNNVVKHAHASQVTVRLEVWPDRAELEINDNGRGFMVDPQQPGGGMGLSSMRERAAALGGSLSVRSEIDRGTSVLVILKMGEGA